MCDHEPDVSVTSTRSPYSACVWTRPTRSSFCAFVRCASHPRGSAGLRRAGASIARADVGRVHTVATETATHRSFGAGAGVLGVLTALDGTAVATGAVVVAGV